MILDKKTEHIIRKYGTPCYVFDEAEVNQQVQRIRKQSSKNYNICFAVKANPFIVSIIDKYVERFEACSPGEYEILTGHGISKEKIVYSGVNKSYKEVLSVYEHGFKGICTIESLDQWEIVKEVVDKRGFNANVLIRLSSGNQFGVSEDDFIHISKEAHSLNGCVLKGLHFFSGTQKKNPKEIKNELMIIKEMCDKIREDEGVEIYEIEYGAGLYAEYFSESDDSDYLKQVFNDIDVYLRDYKVTIELGRYLSYSCGKYYTSVVDVKNTGKRNYVIVDGGIHHISYYGQLLGIKCPKVIHYENEPENPDEKEYTVCGSLCSVNDVLIKNWRGLAKKGDIFEFCKAGAYSSTEGISLFLSRDLPAVISKNEETYVLVRDHMPTYGFNG